MEEEYMRGKVGARKDGERSVGEGFLFLCA